MSSSVEGRGLYVRFGFGSGSGCGCCSLRDGSLGLGLRLRKPIVGGYVVELLVLLVGISVYWN